ncbi:MAG: polysaccharide pyruvyl transferase family protein [Planctomycetota bacterium]|nr:polysaccharide pyruvyl transferase family protein [Planctomycetota bacterium]
MAPTFLLHYLIGFKNYGCEAILRGTVSILRSSFPGCRILYATLSPESDRKALSDPSIEIVDARTPRHHPYRYMNYGLRKIGLGNSQFELPLSEDILRASDVADVLVSIGGDLFTIPRCASPEALAERTYTHPSLTLANKMLSEGKDFVLWGVTSGPFEKWPDAKRKLLELFSSATLITAREEHTVSYLASQGISDNVRLFADPAFAMDAGKVKTDFPQTSRSILGVNLSPLSLKSCFSHPDLSSFASQHAKILRDFQISTGCHIVLIPHVHDHINNDDVSYLKSVWRNLAKNNADSVTCVDWGMGAADTKAVIGRCDLLFSARMHCAVAGCSIATPTVFFGYSSKAAGMCQFVYGSKTQHVDVSSDPSLILKALIYSWKNRHAIKVRLNAKSQFLKSNSLSAGTCLKSILSSSSSTIKGVSCLT